MLLIDHAYPHTMRVPSMSIHLGTISAATTARCPFPEHGIDSWNKKSLPKLAMTLQSGISSRSNAALAIESLSHLCVLRLTNLKTWLETVTVTFLGEPEPE